MSSQPDVFVATLEAASRGVVPNDLALGLQAPSFINSYSIPHLEDVLPGIGDPADLECHTTVFAWTESHGPWIERFPAVLVYALADLPDDKCRDISRGWWERWWSDDEPKVREEMLRDGPYDQLECIILGMKRLARLAIDNGQELFWICPGC